MKFYITQDIAKKANITRQAVIKAVKEGRLKRYAGKLFIFTEYEARRFIRTRNINLEEKE